MPKLSRERLSGTRALVGRDDELAVLDQAWARRDVGVVTIIAIGGAGKTALASWWRTRMIREESELAAVFEWSFYSQGASERNAVSAEGFMREALVFFGDGELADSAAPQPVKAQRLAELIRRERALLLLDGLEPLQHPPTSAGPGTLKEEGMVVLLRELARLNPGLCVVTSREGVVELGELGMRVDLSKLSPAAGAELLREVLEEDSGVRKVESTVAEREEVSKEMQGHALTLLLLGSYVRRALGNLRRWREIDLARADAATQRGHVWRVMDAYVCWLSRDGDTSDRAARLRATYGNAAESASEGQMQLAVLRMMGLFDRPADPGCVEALRREPAIAGLTDALVGLDSDGWCLLLSSLQETRLLSCSGYTPTPVFGHDKATAQIASVLKPGLGKGEAWEVADCGPGAVVLDAHPMVREYFGAVLKFNNKVAWRDGHYRLYAYLSGSVPYWPDGIVSIQPLYQAVVHGCAAGRVQEACIAVYRRRILRGKIFYSVNQLGAFGADLAVVGHFFERAWDRPSNGLSASDRPWVLTMAAYCLRAVGRLLESRDAARTGLKMYVGLEDWCNAAIAAGNLSELELTLGDIRAAVYTAIDAVGHAGRCRNMGQRLAVRTTLADARLAAGEWEIAHAVFQETERIHADLERSGINYDSFRGYRYCDLLLCPAERAAWWELSADMESPVELGELLSICTEVFNHATRSLKRAIRDHATLDIALGHLACGRATLYATRLRSHAPTSALNVEQARDQVDAAVTTLREAGTQHHLPKGLLTRAWLHQLQGHPDLARDDLDEAWTIAARGPMPLHQADIELHRARLFHDRYALARAATLIHQLGYNRRIGELEDAQRSATTWTTTHVIVTPVPPVVRPDVAILIALPEEFETLTDGYTDRWTVKPNPDYHTNDFMFDGPNGYRCVAAIMPRMGPTVAGQTSQRLLAWQPAVIINVGIAGGFHDDLRIGDVIVPREVDGYDETGKIKGTEWQRRGSGYRPNAVPDIHELRFVEPGAHRRWVQAGARTVSELRAGPDAADVEGLITNKLLRSEPKISTNHLASGSFVVASKPFAEWIRSSNADIHAGEMEAAGMMAAAEYRRESVHTLVVRGISDHVDADKSTVDRIGEGALRRLAMANAWRLVEMLMEVGRLPRTEASAEAPLAHADVSTEAFTPKVPAAADSPVVQIWRRKLTFLLEQEPTTVDPDAKFRLQDLIEEARAKIREHGDEA